MQRTVSFLLLLLFSLSSEQCSEVTFNDVYVLVQETKSENYQIVFGCISPKTLKYQKLKSLKVTGQDVSVLKTGAVSNITDSFYLTLNNNNLTAINKDAFLNLPGLESVNLDNNNINWIEPNAFDSLPSLDAINLENNDLEMLLQNTFVNLPNLTIVSLDDNKLEAFKQDWFYKTPKLRYLFLNDNLIRSLSKAAFITLPSLKGISLNNNEISYVNKEAFLGLDGLLEIELGKNRLVSIDIDFKTVPNLAFLAVHQNFLNYVPDDFLKSMQNSLKLIWIYMNPWQCPCLDKILQWGTDKKIKVAWQCKNTELACIIPNDKENECVKRTNTDAIFERQKHFSGECTKIHKV